MIKTYHLRPMTVQKLGSFFLSSSLVTRGASAPDMAKTNNGCERMKKR